MTMEPELKAMNDAYLALKDLEDDAKQRVIDWVTGRFSLANISQKSKTSLDESKKGDREEKKDFHMFDTVADMYAHANVKTEADKVLLVASYLQQSKNGEELTGREINKELNHLGHGVANITVTISSLINKKPKLMIQTRKEGKSQQAQKKYKVTNEGLIEARKMLNPNSTE